MDQPFHKLVAGGGVLGEGEAHTPQAWAHRRRAGRGQQRNGRAAVVRPAARVHDVAPCHCLLQLLLHVNPVDARHEAAVTVRELPPHGVLAPPHVQLSYTVLFIDHHD